MLTKRIKYFLKRWTWNRTRQWEGGWLGGNVKDHVIVDDYKSTFEYEKDVFRKEEHEKKDSDKEDIDESTAMHNAWRYETKCWVSHFATTLNFYNRPN